VKLLDRFILWRARRRHAAYKRWLRKNRVVFGRPDPRCIVDIMRGHNSWR